MPETRNKTIEIINVRQIQKMMLAAAVGLDCSRISDYLKHRPLSTERVEKIESAVEKIVYVWDTFQPFRIVLDSPGLLNQAFTEAQSERELRRSRAAATLAETKKLAAEFDAVFGTTAFS